jgi:predicted DNA-binding protein with PD1-like motif
LEITSLTGNVSIKDGKPLVHVHVTLADKKGNAFGGHLAEGTIVFACEVCIQVFQGEPLKRGFDKTTGLPLWEMDDN